MLDNAIGPDRVELINAAVAREDGVVWFHMGEPEAWYGQAIASSSEIQAFAEPEDAGTAEPTRRTIRSIQSLSLATVISHHPLVDLLDLDIQGVEAVLEGGHIEIDARVRRVRVSTHSDDNEGRLRSLFRSLGWINVHDYSCGHEYNTPYGQIAFSDGVQTWVNPKLCKE